MPGPYTVSVRQNGVIRADVSGLINHHFRDVDRTNGREVDHSNKHIDPSRTGMNVSFVNDGAGGFRRCLDSDEVRDYLNQRLDGAQNFRMRNGKKIPVALRKDAKVIRDWVLELDPEFLKTASAEDVGRYTNVMLREVIKEVGAENLVGGSMHWDETNPHLQFLTTAIDDEGRARWESFRLSKPSELAKFHRQVRQSLIDEGYDTVLENLGTTKVHLKLKDYKNHKDQLRRLKAREAKAEERSASLDARESGIAAKEDAAAQALERARRVQAEYEEKLRDLKDAEVQVEQDAVDARAALDAAKQLHATVKAQTLQQLPEAFMAMQVYDVHGNPSTVRGAFDYFQQVQQQAVQRVEKKVNPFSTERRVVDDRFSTSPRVANNPFARRDTPPGTPSGGPAPRHP